MVECPICGKLVKEVNINVHIDSGCSDLVDEPKSPPSQDVGLSRASQAASFFQPTAQRSQTTQNAAVTNVKKVQFTQDLSTSSQKRPHPSITANDAAADEGRPAKKSKINNIEKVAPLAERMRPKTLDEVCGQELIGANGIIRNLIETDRVPSMILWGGPGTGKTTIARLIAQTAGSRFVEINSTSTGVGEVKKLFSEARNELNLTGRKTIVFCDEIHRFSKSQQDVFLGPVEAGIITLIGATTENPSFKVINALLSRCRVFTLARLSDEHIFTILKRAMALEPPSSPEAASLLESYDCQLLHYLASFSDGDARTALNLLSLAIDLSTQHDITIDKIKTSLTKTLVYDRAGDQHYDTISAFHKSVRGGDADAALYYLARMLQSGEDPLFIARRMVVIASEDVGLADNTLLPLATAAYQAAEKIGMPECRINLAHCCVALCLSPKSTRSYRGLGNAMAALQEPGVAALPIPVYLRNAPTRLMKELNYGKGYKYNPHYRNGQVLQEYLPEAIKGRTFLEDNDLGDQVDEDLLKAKGEWAETYGATSQGTRLPGEGSQAFKSQAQHFNASSQERGARVGGVVVRGDDGKEMSPKPEEKHNGASRGSSPVRNKPDDQSAEKDADEVQEDGENMEVDTHTANDVLYDEHDRSSMPDEGDNSYLNPDGD